MASDTLGTSCVVVLVLHLGAGRRNPTITHEKASGMLLVKALAPKMTKTLWMTCQGSTVYSTQRQPGAHESRQVHAWRMGEILFWGRCWLLCRRQRTSQWKSHQEMKCEVNHSTNQRGIVDKAVSIISTIRRFDGRRKVRWNWRTGLESKWGGAYLLVESMSLMCLFSCCGSQCFFPWSNAHMPLMCISWYNPAEQRVILYCIFHVDCIVKSRAHPKFKEN